MKNGDGLEVRWYMYNVFIHTVEIYLLSKDNNEKNVMDLIKSLIILLLI